MPRVALILSSGRTGTKFLACYLDANYEGVVARHEPPGSRGLRRASHAHMVGAVSRERLARLLRRRRARTGAPLGNRGVELYVESNPFLSGFVEVLGDVFDDPIVIHVVRDPREHARSSLNHGTSTGLKGLANRLVPHWYPDVRRILALDHEPSWIERAAGVWAIANRLLAEHGPRYAHYHRIAYEDLFDARHSGLRALCDALGLTWRESDLAVSPAERINRGRLDVLPPWPEWTPADCRALHAICSPLMERWGYGLEPAWKEKLGGA